MKEKDIVRSIGILNRHFQTYFSMYFKNIDISFSEYIFLINLYENEGINQEELSLILFVDKAATARTIKSLEEKGFLERKIYEKDKRVKNLYLTDKAKHYKNHIYSALEKWLAFTTKGMNKEVIDTIMNGLLIMEKKVVTENFDKLLCSKNDI